MKYIATIFFLFLASYLFSQTTYVSDDNFENYLETHDAFGNVVAVGDANSMGNGIANDDYVTTSAINTVTKLHVINRNIADMTGIEDFTALTELNCHDNQISSLDVSQNTTLTILNCTENQLTGLDVSQNTALTSLYFNDNQISSIDVTQNTILTVLECRDNQLTSLDVSQNTALVTLLGSNNQIGSLDVSQNTALETLWCSSNQLSSIDVTLNTALRVLYCNNNQISSIDVTQNTALEILRCHNYPNSILYNQLTSLDVSQNTALLSLWCANNQLTSLDVSQNTALVTLLGSNNQLSNLNVKNGHNTNFTHFDVVNNPNLTCVEVDNAAWSTANWTQIDATSSFSENCHYNETYIPDNNFENYLETHDANGNVVAVGDANSMGNGIVNDDYVTTSKISSVVQLNVFNQNISDLTGIGDFTFLENLSCGDNSIANVDLSQNLALLELDISLNFLTNLDLNSNTLLEILNCSENGIQTLDLSLHSGLVELDCSDNGLIALNVKNGNNYNVGDFVATQNQNLLCVEVDDRTYSTTNWTDIDVQTSFNTNCANPETYVPDDNFENYLETHDANGNVVAVGDANSMGNGIVNDDYVTTANINTVTQLNVTYQNISDMTGIEDFVALQILQCYYNAITSLDVSNNLALTQLRCFNNQLTSLDLTSNYNLIVIECYRNQLTSLNTNSVSTLTKLWCFENQLTSLNVTTNANLQDLQCYNNQIISLDLNSNTALTYLQCAGNLLTNLDVATNTSLTNLMCDDNQLTNLDVSQNTLLVYLRCNNNQLTDLNVKNTNNTNFAYFNAMNNPDLTCIEVDDAAWSPANWTNIDATSTFVNNQSECSILSTHELATNNKLNFFPNPVEDVFTLSISEKSKYLLVNINGQIIKEGDLKVGENEINISKFQNGIYILKVYEKKKTLTNKVYKK